MTASVTTKKVANKPGVWYKVYISECVICGAYDEERVRMAGPKPENPHDRYSRREYGCCHHFV